MDDIVLKAMARWPDVPSVYGWLSLDRRGQWRIKGETISNPQFTSCIGRNYARDVEGRWYFQNGPQRVFVQLEYMPTVVHVENAAGGGLVLVTHTGLHLESLEQAWLDETGSLVLQRASVAALLLDRDLERILDWLEDAQGRPASSDQIEACLQGQGELYFRYSAAQLPLRRLLRSDAPRLFRFVADPRPAPGEPDC
jgi:hypothetical protein